MTFIVRNIVVFCTGLWVALFICPPKTAFSITPEKLLQNVYTLAMEDTIQQPVDEYVSEILSDLHNLGYLEAQPDSIVKDALQYTIYISKGNPFHYLIRSNNISSLILNKVRLDNRFEQESLSFEEFDRNVQEVLDYYSNHGYPFARINKNNVEITQNTIAFDLEVDPMDYIVFDSLNVTGDVQLSTFYLENHLNIRQGEPYNEKLVNDAGQKLRELDYVELNQPLQVSFSPGKASLHIPLSKSRSNRFDGVAGLAGSDDPDASMHLTGMLNLYLSNFMAMGENLEVSWQGLGHGTQILNMQGGYPYPFRLPLTTEINFELHKQDTSWLQLQVEPAIFTELTAQTSLGVFMHHASNALISTEIYHNNLSVPENLDFRLQLYGLHFRTRTRAYHQQLLQSGHIIFLSAAAGTREILKNDNVPAETYEETEGSIFQFNGKASLEKRWQTGSRATVSAGINAATIGGNNIPGNMLTRLGGFKTLKGFDELSLAASSYALADAEFRFFTAPASFFSLFVNGGWYERMQLGHYANDWVLGVGAGVNLETQAGIFALYMGLGTRKNIPLELRNAKIHVGYISQF